MIPIKHQSIDGFRISGNWAIQSKLLQRSYSQLTTADLEFEIGHEQTLIQKIGNKLKIKQGTVIDIINKNRYRKFRLL